MAKIQSVILFLCLTLGAVSCDKCEMRNATLVLRTPGCETRVVETASCFGECNSFVEVSGSNDWELTRSCQCCSEGGTKEREITLKCPDAAPGTPKFHRIKIMAPLECSCRPCSVLDESGIVPQEISNFMDDAQALSLFPFRMKFSV